MEETTTKRPRKVKVQILRGYVPADAPTNAWGGYDKLRPGDTASLPASEAAFVIKAGIATTTADSFED